MAQISNATKTTDFISKRVNYPKVLPAKSTAPVNKTTVQYPPLSEPFGPILEKSGELKEPVRSMSTLPSGLRIVTEDCLDPLSSVGFCVHVGKQNEDPSNYGVTSVITNCLFSGVGKSGLPLQVEAREIGATAGAINDSGLLYFGIECSRNHVPEAMELLSNALCKFTITEEMLENEVHGFQDEIEETYEYKEELINYALLPKVAYGDTPSGSSILDYEFSVPKLSPQDVINFKNKFIVPSKSVLTGVNVSSDEMKTLAEKYFSKFVGDEPPPSDPIKYIGGQHFLQSEDGLQAAFSLSFRAEGWLDKFGGINWKKTMAFSVLERLLGGGDSFQSGGPGSGSISRLFVEIIHRDMKVSSCSSSSAPAGFENMVLSITGLCEHGHLENFYKTVLGVYSSILEDIQRNPAKIEQELHRARLQTLSALFNDLTHPLERREDISRQVFCMC
eukprot:TRINITY_DN6891_c0_g1_i2.p1 TRINITY_DN6891_c0_g1~~TRINITY_DN6891_c0_g1_i2.p1  ORF type:complete len:491 (+),score=104.08 TRINITY_DN6891_c0_g1_i2:133-1473(+)